MESDKPTMTLKAFLKRQRENPPPLRPPESPLPPDLAPVKDAAKAARMHPQTIYRLASRGYIRLWGYPGMYRVSISEVMPEATRLTDSYMRCIICARRKWGRPSIAANGWRALQVTERRHIFVCPQHFRVTNAKVGYERAEYSKGMVDWLQVILAAVKRSSPEEAREFLQELMRTTEEQGALRT